MPEQAQQEKRIDRDDQRTSEASPLDVAVYRKNKQHFDDWCGSERTQKENWQRAFGASALLNLVLAGGFIYVATLPKRVVVPIFQDSATGTLSTGRAPAGGFAYLAPVCLRDARE